MSANPRINSVPPQDPDPTSHIHHYLSTFNPHLPRIAQEGYHQFADEQEYGLEEVRSYWQGDGSSSVPDRHALEAGIHAGERDTRTWQGDHDRHRGMEEYKRGRGVYTGGDRRVGRPVSTPPQQRHQKEESIRAVRRDLGRFASVPLQEQSQNGTSTREGVEERAARAPRGRVDGSVHARDETESAHRRHERKMRRRERAAIRKPPPLLHPPPVAPPRRHLSAQSSVASNDRSESDRAVQRPAKKVKASHRGEEMMRNFRSEHVTTGRLTLRPGQAKGKGFLGGGKTSGIILGGRPKVRGQHPSQSGSSERDWTEKWRLPTKVQQPQQAVPSPDKTGDHAESANAAHGAERPEISQREQQIVQNSRLPPPGKTNSPSWSSIHSHPESAGRPSLAVTNRGDIAPAINQPPLVPREHAIVLKSLGPPPAPSAEHRKSESAISFFKAAATPQAVWRPRPATGFGKWASAATPAPITAPDKVPIRSADDLAKTSSVGLRLPTQSTWLPAESLPTSVAATRGVDSTFGRPPTFGNQAAPAIETADKVPLAAPAEPVIRSDTFPASRLPPAAASTTFGQPSVKRPAAATRSTPLIQVDVPSVHTSAPTAVSKPLIRFETGASAIEDVRQTAPVPSSPSRQHLLVDAVRPPNRMQVASPAVLLTNHVPREPDVEPAQFGIVRNRHEQGIVHAVPPDQETPHMSHGRSPAAPPSGVFAPRRPFQLDAGEHNPFTDSHNPFLAPNPTSSCSRSGNLHQQHPNAFDSPPVAYMTPARPFIPTFDSLAGSSFKNRPQQDPQIGMNPYVRGRSRTPQQAESFQTPKRPDPRFSTPLTGFPLLAAPTPTTVQLDDELSNFWINRPAFR